MTINADIIQEEIPHPAGEAICSSFSNKLMIVAYHFAQAARSADKFGSFWNQLCETKVWNNFPLQEEMNIYALFSRKNEICLCINLICHNKLYTVRVFMMKCFSNRIK